MLQPSSTAQSPPSGLQHENSPSESTREGAILPTTWPKSPPMKRCDALWNRKLEEMNPAKNDKENHQHNHQTKSFNNLCNQKSTILPASKTIKNHHHENLQQKERRSITQNDQSIQNFQGISLRPTLLRLPPSPIHCGADCSLATLPNAGG